MLSKHSYQLKAAEMFDRWEEIVGEKINSVSRPYKIFDKVLYVAVSENHWLLELTYHQPKILETTKALFPDINLKSVYFKYDPKRDYSLLKKTDEKTEADFDLEKMEDVKTQKIAWEKEDDLLAKSLYRLMQTYGKTKKCIEEKGERYVDCASVQKNERKKDKKHLSEMDEFYPENGIASQFLLQKDDFQSFDLY